MAQTLYVTRLLCILNFWYDNHIHGHDNPRNEVKKLQYHTSVKTFPPQYYLYLNCCCLFTNKQFEEVSCFKLSLKLNWRCIMNCVVVVIGHKTRNLDPLGGGNMVRDLRDSRRYGLILQAPRRLDYGRYVLSIVSVCLYLFMFISLLIPILQFA